MMTPKEVQEHGFPRARKGYDMAEVDDFLDKLTEDYTALYTNYGKLSASYTKLRKKAQTLASALEQTQSKSAKLALSLSQKPVVPAAAPAPAAAAPVVQQPAVTAASQDAVDELLRTARKDAEAIRAGAERERQEIIAQATNYASENAERLKAEVAAEEARLAELKRSTAAYVSQVRALIGRQVALLDGMPVKDEDYAPAAAAAASVIIDEPTTRVAEPVVAAPAAGALARSVSEDLALNTEDLDSTGSLFDVIEGTGLNEE